MTSHALVLLALAGLSACGSPAPGAAAPAPPPAPAAEAVAPAPSPEAQLARMRQDCADAQAAITARQAATSLYERIGGEARIRAFVTETVRLHQSNDAIAHLFTTVDDDAFIDRVTSFLTAGTGGPGTYEGRDMTTAHAHLKLTTADFLSAGGDLGASMVTVGVGSDEIQEVTCAFVALSDQVIAPAPTEEG